MKGLDDYIMGIHDPNAPFNQPDIEDVWGDTLDALSVSDDEYDTIFDDDKTEEEIQQAYNAVLDCKFKELQKQYADEIAKQFLSIRKCRLFKEELTD